MKKQIILGTLVAVAASPALATRARLLALGENQNNMTGSQYIADNRNIFLNAAHLNDFSNSVYLELGGAGSQTLGATTKAGDSDISQQAEGGAFVKYGNLNYGLYYGRESAYVNEVRSYTRLFNSKVQEDDQLDGFVAGQFAGGTKWGANATWSRTKDDSVNARQNSMSVRLGAIGTSWEGFFNFSTINHLSIDAVGASGKDTFDGKLGLEAGGTYDVSGLKVYGYIRHATWEQHGRSQLAQAGVKDGTSYQGKADGSFDKYMLGVGKVEKVSDKGTLYTKIGVDMTKRQLDTKNDGKANLDDTTVPVVIGMEYDATSWLTVRGSVVQNLWGQEDNDYDASLNGKVSTAVTNSRAAGKRTVANTTGVNTGATLKFGELSIDGMVGVNDASGNVSNNAASFTAAKKGVLSTENLMSRVSMTYKF